MSEFNSEITTPIAKSNTAKWSYTSLIFSCFYFFPLIFSNQTIDVTHIAYVVAIYLCFLGLFITTVNSVGRSASYPIIAIIVLAATATWVYQGTNVLFGYAAFFTSYYFRPKYAVGLFLFNLMAQLTSAYSFELVSIYYLGPAIAITISLHVYGYFSRKEALNELQNKRHQQELEKLAAIAERERIARDMHDLLGHSLSSLALKSELAQKLIGKGQQERAAQEISEVAAVARATLAEVREAITGLKLKSLKTGLKELTNELRNMGFNCQSIYSVRSIEAKLESTLLLLCREWTTNILRHSNGSHVSLELKQNEKDFTLVIKDNGEVDKIVPGNGINGIIARVEEFNGSVSIDLESGVALRVVIPNSLSQKAA